MKAKLLLVDDNVDYLDSTKDVLEEEGYDVITASSGEEAIAMAQASSFDVVLMDIKMPGKNGVETFVEIKRYLPHVKVIICTAYIVEKLIHQALKEGAYAVLNKPFEMSVLLRTIENAYRKIIPGRILVADQDQNLCLEMQHALSGHGHQVMVTYDGKEAIECGKQYAPNIVVLEMNLPSINGLDVYRILQERHPGIFAGLIIGTQHDIIGPAREALKRETGVTYLMKPLDMSHFLDLVDNILLAHHQSRSPGKESEEL